MTTSERKIYPNVGWDSYVQIPAHSFSSLNGTFSGPPTKKMQLGTRVDHYMFEPAKYDGGDLKLVRQCAAVLKTIVGSIRYESQLTATANFHHNGFTMPVRGRLDMRIPGLVMDLKISEMDPWKSIAHFRYDWQLSGYAAMTGDSKIILISINPKTFKPTIVPITMKFDWWEQQILINGKRN